MGDNADSMSQKEKAIEYFEKAISANPKYARASFLAGYVSKGMKKMEEAKQYYKKAIEANPRYTSAYNNLGIIHRD